MEISDSEALLKEYRAKKNEFNKSEVTILMEDGEHPENN